MQAICDSVTKCFDETKFEIDIKAQEMLSNVNLDQA